MTDANAQPDEVPEAFGRGRSTIDDFPVDAELLCPVCNYNLQGLTSRQCPECGSAFDPTLLRNALAARGHPWLFEHGKWPSPLRYLQTNLRSLALAPLWRSLDAAHTIRVGRLTLYATITAGLAFVTALALHGLEQAVIGSSPWVRTTYTEVMLEAASQSWPILLWIPASLASLTIFTETLRSARLRKAQLYRMIVYAADGLWVLPLFTALSRGLAHVLFAKTTVYTPYTPTPPSLPVTYHYLTEMISLRADLLVIALTLLVLTLRLALSTRLYLRIPRLWLDVLLSQFVALTLVGAALLLFTNVAFQFFYSVVR